MLVESGDGKVTYERGSRKCMVVREGTGAEELFKMMRKIIGSDILKYDREMLVAVEVDSDVEVIFKGNDERGYIYVAGNAGPMRREHARGAVCEARERDTGEGKQIGRSGRKCNDVQEVGEERGNNEAGIKRYDFCTDVGGHRRRGAAGEQATSRRDTIEMSDEDEISVASEDAGDREAAEEDDAGDEGAAEKRCANANLWVYDYVHPIYKTSMQEVIYNKLVHPMKTHDMAGVDGKIGLVVGGMNWMRTTTDAYYLPTMADTRAGHHRSEESHKRRTRNCGDAPNAVTLAIQGTRAVILELISMQVVKVYVEWTESVCSSQVGDAWHASVYVYLVKVQTCLRDCLTRTMGSATGVSELVRCPLQSVCVGNVRHNAAMFCISRDSCSDTAHPGATYPVLHH
ncbi:hypothetical protein Cgig2_019278 [Carnegiea gigantea]|uniref:Uncharacterized protein n=1 Tax=Carnegiea gigantea TaxID=171969 RepID=A0A9Q1QNB6_9CARY|nr:hypothetical protein Cgig2_019278 [Carnegiea gigantea]